MVRPTGFLPRGVGLVAAPPCAIAGGSELPAPPHHRGVDGIARTPVEYVEGWRGGTLLGELRGFHCALRSARFRSDGDDAGADRVLDQFGRGLEPEDVHEPGPVELG